jgi:hypothetical protein
MKTIPLMLCSSGFLLVSCDRDEGPWELRADNEYANPANPGRQEPKEQAVPQGAQATGDAQTRSASAPAGEGPTSGDHVGAGGHAAGSPGGAPTSGGTGRPEEKK